MDIALVLDKIRPGAAWRMADTYENLKATWEDKKQTLPTLEELESAWADMNKGPTLAELQDKAWARIKAERDKREQAGAPYLTGTLDSDSVSTQRIAIAVQAAQAAKSAGTAFTLDWTMQDNSVIAMTADQVIGMATALATHSNAVHEASRTARTAIYAATDATGVTAAETAVVWP